MCVRTSSCLALKFDLLMTIHCLFSCVCAVVRLPFSMAFTTPCFIVADVAMVPRAFATPATLAARVDAYEKRCGSNHCPQHPRFRRAPSLSVAAVVAAPVEAAKATAAVEAAGEHQRECRSNSSNLHDLMLRRLVGYSGIFTSASAIGSSSEGQSSGDGAAQSGGAGCDAPSVEAMAAMAAANACEAAGDLAGAKRHLADAERLGHSLLKEHGGWR